MTEPINATIARLIRQANAAAARGDYPAAQHLAREAVERSQLVFHQPSRAAAHYTLATMLWSDETARAEEAQVHAATAAKLARPHTDEYYMAITLLARIEAGLGHLERAQALNENLLDIYQRKNRPQGIADVLRSFGDLALKRNDLPAAREFFEQSQALYESVVDDPLNQAGLLISMGSLAFREGDMDQARQHWERACALGQKHHFNQIITYAQRALDALAQTTADE